MRHSRWRFFIYVCGQALGKRLHSAFGLGKAAVGGKEGSSPHRRHHRLEQLILLRLLAEVGVVCTHEMHSHVIRLQKRTRAHTHPAFSIYDIMLSLYCSIVYINHCIVCVCVCVCVYIYIYIYAHIYIIHSTP